MRGGWGGPYEKGVFKRRNRTIKVFSAEGIDEIKNNDKSACDNYSD